jgi:alkylation response protein AidB-like acyl-CoA dehydrogenase
MPVSLQDIRFVMHEVLDYAGHYAELQPPPAAVPDRAFIDALLDEAHRFTDSVLEPLNAIGDREGCRFNAGAVTTPEGFKAAYQTYAGGGWAGMTGDPAHGGQGLPHSLSLLLEDLISCANLAWGMYPALSRGVINALTDHGSDRQKAEYLPNLLSGRWTGTMCLTEPHAGSDVGLARTRAEPGADGAYRITGTKIFISAGDHDLAENILHLVLARLPDAPAGTRGISMFVVPKLLADGRRNGVECGGIEHKMGIHGNATCTLNFDGAVGQLVGEPNRGMRYMFTMMNAARLLVGLQGVCGAHAACLRSLAYATERLQMRSLTGPVAPDRPADPIIAHGDVRRMLLTQRAIAEGGRLLVYYAGQIADLTRHGDELERRQAMEQLDFLTPIVKGVLTELGYESVNHAVQIYGGHGYVRDNGVEQYVRDLRIALIYEGTTQIQALDLLGRKVLQTQGKGLMHFLAEVGALESRLRPLRPELADSLGALSREWGDLALAIGAKAGGDLNEVAAGAVDFLFYSGYAVLAYCWARMAETAATRLGDGHDDFLQGKLAVADFYFARMLPRRLAHKLAIEAGPTTLLGPDAGIVAAL